MTPLYRFAAPSAFYPVAGKMIPYFAWAAGIFAVIGLYLGLVVAPVDFQQGEHYRILFIHVPTAWMAMFTYFVMCGYAVLTLTFRTRLSALMMRALAPTGTVFAVLALLTGSFWGKPTWGAWWVWDARTTSTLILLFLYIGYLALENAIEDPLRGDRAGALLILVGSVNLPIIYFSVQWWNTLHQGSSINLTAAPAMARVMVESMLALTLAAWFYTIAVSLVRVRQKILLRERSAQWVLELALGAQGV
ncbi:MAG: heme ABC transporter permease CcmC [Burkholderiaceae bacterium]|jgi:heme exporter protein C